MGSYFITNDEKAVSLAITLMAQKGLSEYEELKVGDVTILSFQKIFAKNHCNIYKHKDDFIVGFGTYFYKGKFGAAALQAIYEDLCASTIPWKNVTGHFSFATCLNGNTTLVTDKCGVYHGYQGAHGAYFYSSNSLFAVASSLPKLTVSGQECIEYLYTQGTYGGRTIFEEIDHLEAGSVYSLAPFKKQNQYYTPAQEAISIDQYMIETKEYFEGYQQSDFAFNCDLTGGYDSRTVAALLENAGVVVEYNTNTNPKDPDDHKVALELANALNRKIHLLDRQETATFEQMVERCFLELEICRDVFTACYTPYVFTQKADSFDMAIGGYGGELLRDKYSRYESIQEMVAASYIDTGLKLDQSAKEAYLASLTEKFKKTISPLNLEKTKDIVEAIYYLEKMRYWGGSRITAFNQYCFRVHPLLDDALAKYSFGFSLKEKGDAKLQRQIITQGSETLARQRSSYFDKPLYLKGEDDGLSPSARASLKLKRSKYLLYQLKKSLRNTSFFASSKSRDYVSVFAVKGYLAKLLGIDFKDVFNMKIRGRYLTLEKTLHQFRDKTHNL